MQTLERLIAELTSGEDAHAESSIPEIIALGDEALGALLEITRSADANDRWWAVRALAGFPRIPVDELLPLLDDPESDVRAAAALALCNHPSERSVPALIKALGDPDNLTAGLVVNALVTVGSPAVPALLECMEGGQRDARILALRALAEIGDHRAVPAFMQAVEHDSALAQYWAKNGLDRLGLEMIYIKPE